MDDQAKLVALAYTFAADVAKQIMTLSTGVVALSITFAKDLVRHAPPNALKALRVSWVLYLASLLFGVWTLMALTGSLDAATKPPPDPAKLKFGFNVYFPAALQILSFLAATVSMVLFGWQALMKHDSQP